MNKIEIRWNQPKEERMLNGVVTINSNIFKDLKVGIEKSSMVENIYSIDEKQLPSIPKEITNIIFAIAEGYLRGINNNDITFYSF